MNATLPVKAAVLVSILSAFSLVFCVPVLAQSAPSAAQYEGGGSGSCPPNMACAQGVEDGINDLPEHVGQGTGAVNDALAEPEASAGTSTAPSGSVKSAVSEPSVSEPAGSAPAGSVTNNDGGTEAGVPGSITELPETGGASLTALYSGVLLVMAGALTRALGKR